MPTDTVMQEAHENSKEYLNKGCAACLRTRKQQLKHDSTNSIGNSIFTHVLCSIEKYSKSNNDVTVIGIPEHTSFLNSIDV